MLAALSLMVLLPMLAGCPNRKQVLAEVWQNSGLPSDLCEKAPELKQYGIFRKLDSGKYEFLSYCTQGQDKDGKPFPLVQNYIGMLTQKFQSLLDALLPEKGGK